jgi:hypothetical protein
MQQSREFGGPLAHTWRSHHLPPNIYISANSRKANTCSPFDPALVRTSFCRWLLTYPNTPSLAPHKLQQKQRCTVGETSVQLGHQFTGNKKTEMKTGESWNPGNCTPYAIIANKGLNKSTFSHKSCGMNTLWQSHLQMCYR